jgi:hypothetical protein
MTTTNTLKVGDIVQKRASKAPFPRLFRIVEFILDGTEALVRPAGGGSLLQVDVSAIRKAD